jgi:hypothetical protein
MRVLTFEQITDSRFDENIKELLEQRVQRLEEEFSKLEGVSFEHDNICFYEGDEWSQYRCRCYVKKSTRKITWNDIYRLVNNIKAVPYDFTN